MIVNSFPALVYLKIKEIEEKIDLIDRTDSINKYNKMFPSNGQYTKYPKKGQKFAQVSQ